MSEQQPTYSEGSIVYASWGWEQTNIDWFKIVKRSGLWLTLQPLKANQVDDGAQTMTGRSMPGRPSGAPNIRRRLHVRDGEEHGCRYQPYSMGGWISLWDGKPKAYSCYA